MLPRLEDADADPWLAIGTAKEIIEHIGRVVISKSGQPDPPKFRLHGHQWLQFGFREARRQQPAARDQWSKGYLSSCEWVAAVDQERRRAVKVETLCVFGRINALLSDLHVFASDVGQRLPQPPFSQFPVRTAVEELDGDFHGCDEPRTISGPGPRFWCSRR